VKAGGGGGVVKVGDGRLPPLTGGTAKWSSSLPNCVRPAKSGDGFGVRARAGKTATPSLSPIDANRNWEGFEGPAKYTELSCRRIDWAYPATPRCPVALVAQPRG